MPRENGQTDQSEFDAVIAPRAEAVLAYLDGKASGRRQFP
jgi:hypothetical protein